VKRRGADAALGLLLVIALAAGLVLGLDFTRRAKDLRVTVRSPDPFEIAPLPGAPLAPAVAGPPSLLPRLELDGAPDRGDPGLWLRTWQVTYGHRWERQVTLPVLAGPFDPEGKPWPCAVAVRFSPRFFDDGRPGGEDVAAVVDRVVRAQFPFAVMGLRFGPVASTSLHVRPVEGGLDVSGGVVLADSARDPTRFDVKARIALGERDGDLAARIEHVAVAWRGRTRANPLVELASLFLDVDEQARRVLTEKLGGALAILHLPKEPVAVFADRPGDRFTLRLCDAPDAHASGLTLRLRMIVSLAEPRVLPAIPGPPHLEERPTLPPPAGDAPTFEAAASAAAVQQALYAMWQGGELRAWGRDPRVIAAMRRKLGDRLAFELGAGGFGGPAGVAQGAKRPQERGDPSGPPIGIEARLPPVVLPEGAGDALRVRFAALDIGAAGDRRVLAHGDVIARARVEGGAVGLAGTLAELRVSCAEPRGGEQRLVPCFSDVVPALRESGLTAEGLPMDLKVPDRLMRLNLVLGTDLATLWSASRWRWKSPW